MPGDPTASDDAALGPRRPLASDPGSITAAVAPSYSELTTLAVQAALAGARLIAGRRNPRAVDSKSNDTDPVTDVDRAAERAVVDELRAHRGADAVLGEEGGADAGAQGASSQEPGVRWIIDPIDGTVNFVLGLPIYAVSVAAEVAGVVVAGCVVDAGRARFDIDGRHVAGDVFWAQLGAGSYRNDASDGTTQVLAGPFGRSLAHSVVGTGFAYDAATRRRQGLTLAAVIERVANVRRLGSAALDLCYVASGQLDAYYEAGTKVWDRAAGLLIATEAGVRVGALDGDFEHCLLAAHRASFDELSALLRQAGADRVLNR